MKKLLSILGLVAVVGAGSFAFASDGIVEDKTSQDESNYEQEVDENVDYNREGLREENNNYRRGHCWRDSENRLSQEEREELRKERREGNFSQEEREEWQEHHRGMHGDGYNNPNGRRGMHRNGRRGR